MKIITEKVHSEPAHAITKKEVGAIIDVVPDDWIGVAHVFLISAQLFENSNWDRPVIQNNTTFKILSRGIEKNLIIKELLIEMAIRPTQTYPPRGHTLTKSQRRKLEELIEPYYNKLIK
jgi:hypothetical protein